MFMAPGEDVYPGEIVGLNARDNDLVVNVCKGKKLTNIRAAGSDETIILTPPREFSLEEALEFIEADELVEVTPKSVRLRKRALDHNQRKRDERSADSSRAGRACGSRRTAGGRDDDNGASVISIRRSAFWTAADRPADHQRRTRPAGAGPHNAAASLTANDPHRPSRRARRSPWRGRLNHDATARPNAPREGVAQPPQPPVSSRARTLGPPRSTEWTRKHDAAAGGLRAWIPSREAGR
jgi:hypothetical protein